MLTAAESIITYRRRYRSQAQLETLLDLLLLDAGNPRSVAYQLDRLIGDLDALPNGDQRLRDEQRLLLEASTALRLVDTAALVAQDGSAAVRELDAFLARLLDLLLRAADAVDRVHFVQLLPQRQLVGPRDQPPTGATRRDEERETMAMTYKVTHRTEYVYESGVAPSYSQLHLLPRDLPGQRCRAPGWSSTRRRRTTESAPTSSATASRTSRSTSATAR